MAKPEIQVADVSDINPNTDIEPASGEKKRVRKKSKKTSVIPSDSVAPDAPAIIEASQDQPDEIRETPCQQPDYQKLKESIDKREDHQDQPQKKFIIYITVP